MESDRCEFFFLQNWDTCRVSSADLFSHYKSFVSEFIAYKIIPLGNVFFKKRELVLGKKREVK